MNVIWKFPLLFTDHGAFVWHVFDGGERDG